MRKCPRLIKNILNYKFFSKLLSERLDLFKSNIILAVIYHLCDKCVKLCSTPNFFIITECLKYLYIYLLDHDLLCFELKVVMLTW